MKDPSSKVLDSFTVTKDSTFIGRRCVRAELIEHLPGPQYPDQKFWAIKIWRRHVDHPEKQFPSQVHVGQEKYIRRLWKGYLVREFIR